METVQQNGRFTLFSSKFLSIYSILYDYREKNSLGRAIQCIVYTVQCTLVYQFQCTIYSVQCVQCTHVYQFTVYMDSLHLFTSFIVQFTVYSVHMCTSLQCTVDSVHLFTSFTVQFTVYSVHLYTNLQCTVDSVHLFTSFIVHCTIYSVQCTHVYQFALYNVQSVQCTLVHQLYCKIYSYSVQCTLVYQFILYNVQSVQCALVYQCTLYNAQCTRFKIYLN